MDKKRLVKEGAVQQSKDEATIQVFLASLLLLSLSSSSVLIFKVSLCVCGIVCVCVIFN